MNAAEVASSSSLSSIVGVLVLGLTALAAALGAAAIIERRRRARAPTP